MLVDRDLKVVYCNAPQRQIEDLCNQLGWEILPVAEAAADVPDVPSDIVVGLMSARIEHRQALDREEKRAALRKAFASARRWMRFSRRNPGGA